MEIKMDLNVELMRAAWAKVADQNRVLQLIRHGANVQKEDRYGFFPLHWAVLKGHYNICKTLLENGAQPNTLDRCGESSPLTRATSAGNEIIVRLLLENGADANLKPKNGNNAFDLVLKETNTNDFIIRMLTLLLEYGADINNVSGKVKPLHWACGNNRKKVVELLLHKGVNTDTLDDFNRKAVDIAMEKGYIEIVYLIEMKYFLWLRLYFASERGNYLECRRLLDREALVNCGQYGLYCPVAAASEKGNYRIVKLLIDKGITIKNKNRNNERNPLYLAIRNGHQDIASLLLDNGASPNVIVNGNTLLHVATQNNHLHLVRFLIKTELNVKNYEGYTPLHYAVVNGNEHIVTCLIEHGAIVNLVTNSLDTPLHLACEGGHQRIADILLKNGANVDALNEHNEKPTDIIIRKLRIMNNMNELLNGPNVKIHNLSRAAYQHVLNDENYDSDSDATVDYYFSGSIPKKPKLTNHIMDLSDLEEFRDKMSCLSVLVMELNEKEASLELLETDIALEDNLKNILEKNRFSEVLNCEDSEAQLDHKEANQESKHRVEECEIKKAQVEKQVETLQTNIKQIKTTVRRRLREIARLIK